MNRSTAAVIAALTLWTAACGVTAESERSARSTTYGSEAATDEFAGEDWEEDLFAEDEPGEEAATDEDAVSEDEDSGVAESDEGSDGSEESGDEGSSTPADPGEGETSSGGAAPGVYAAPEGGVEYGYDLRFEVSDDGAVLHGLEANVLTNCDGSSTSETVMVGGDLAWDIVDGRFSARYQEDVDGGAFYTTMEGSFSGTTATGTVRLESVVAGSVCDTYALDFTAELT